jgi:hypothetical protein
MDMELSINPCLEIAIGDIKCILDNGLAWELKQ